MRTNIGMGLVVALLKSLAIVLGGLVLLRASLLGFESYVSTPPELKTITAIFDGSLVLGLGSPYESADYGVFLDMAWRTGAIVLIGLLWSTTFSVLLGFHLAKRPHGVFWRLSSDLASLASGLPLFVVGLIAFAVMGWYFETHGIAAEGATVGVFKIIVGGLLLGSFEGALGELYRAIRSILSDLQEKAYFLAHKARGQSTVGLVYRTIRPYLLDCMPTRVSYFVGAAIVIESTLDIHGLGFKLIASIRTEAEQRMAYRNGMIAGLMIIMFPLVCHLILQGMEAIRFARSTTVSGRE